MEDDVLLAKNQKSVKIFSWIIIIASGLALFSGISGLVSSSFANSILGDFNMSSNKVNMHINEIPGIIMNLIKILICALIVLSAIFVLQYREIWRKRLLIGLILAIIYMMISPLISYLNFPRIHFSNFGNMPANVGNMEELVKTMTLMFGYLWSIAWSVFFIITIVKFNKSEIKLMFK